MSVSWATTDPTRSRPALARHETFHGYFTDIQRAARRSLPKRPSHDLRELLGLKLVPSARTKLPSTPSASIQEGSFGTICVPEPPAPVQSNQLETNTPKQSASEKLRSLVPCSDLDGYSWREKTICGCNLYFAIVIFLLLIIVIILASTVSAITRQNADSDGQGSQVSIINPTIPPTVTDTTTTVLRSVTSVLTSPSTSQYRSTSTTSHVLTSTVSASQSSASIASTTKQSSTGSAVTSISHKSSTYPDTSISTSANITHAPTVISTSSGISDASAVSVTSSHTQTPSTSPSSVSPKSTKTSFTSSLSTASSSASDSTGTTVFLSKITEPATTQSTSDNTMLTDSSPNTTTASSTEPTSAFTSSSTPAIIPKLKKPNITCSTNKCTTAKSTIARADFSISPCQDFFQFSCGAWEAETLADWRKGTIKNVPLTLQDELRQNLLLQIRDTLQEPYSEAEAVGPRVSRRLYQACVESNVNKDTALGEVERIKSLQQLHSLVDWLGVKQDLRINNNVNNLLYSANSAFQVTPFLKMSTVATLNDRDVNVYALQIEPPTLYLGSEGYQSSYSNNTRAKRYVQVSTEILYSYLTSFPFIGNPVRRKRSRRLHKRQLGVDNPTASFGQTSMMVLRSYNIEQAIWQIVNTTSFPGNGLPTEATQVRLSVLKSRYSNIPWESAIGLSNNNALIRIVNPSYFQVLDTLLPTLDKVDLMMQTFLTILLQRIWPYMPWPFRRNLQEFGHNDDLLYSEIDCVEHALNLAREEIHALYIGSHTRQVLNNRFNIANMIHVTKGYFQQLLSFAEWIQPDLERLMTALMTNLKSHFSSVKSKVRETSALTGANQTFLSLALALHGQLYEGGILKIGSNVTEEIDMDWTRSTVFYDPYFNMLGLPTGMTVYMAENAPEFSHYGSLQMLLSAAFIEILSQGELEGELTLSWWGPQSIQEFVTVLNCFGIQMSTLQLSNNEIGSVIRFNGAAQLTKQIYEGISRTGASYINGTTLTENMLFYMNIAQVYCRADDYTLQHQLLKQRINNAMMNIGDFEATFSCPSSSRLVSSNTCSLFK